MNEKIYDGVLLCTREYSKIEVEDNKSKASSFFNPSEKGDYFSPQQLRIDGSYQTQTSPFKWGKKYRVIIMEED